MIPVWPVARKSASRPRDCSARAIASAVYFLPSAQSVPTVSSRFPLRFSPVPIGIFVGRPADVDQPRPQPLGRFLQFVYVAKPRVHPADDVQPGIERVDQGRDPAWR